MVWLFKTETSLNFDVVGLAPGAIKAIVDNTAVTVSATPLARSVQRNAVVPATRLPDFAGQRCARNFFCILIAKFMVQTMNAVCSLLIVLLLGASWAETRAQDLTPAQRAEHEKAIQIYTGSVIPSDPKNARSYQIRGYAYFCLGQNEQALNDYSLAIKYAPGFSDHYLHRAEVFTAMANYDKALEDLNAAIHLSPQRASAYVDRARVYWNLKRYSEAAADHQQAVTLDPRNACGCNAFAWFLMHCPEEKLRDETKAVQMAQRACSLSANTPAYVETLRDALAAQKAHAVLLK